MRFGLLGPLVVGGDDGGRVPLDGGRLRVLLAALLLQAPTPVSWEALAEKARGQNDPLSIKSLEVIIDGLKKIEEASALAKDNFEALPSSLVPKVQTAINSI